MYPLACIRSFLADRRANIAITFGVALPVLLAGMGVAIDYGNASSRRSRLQAVADSAALAAARELRLASTSAQTASEVARRVIDANADESAAIAFEGRPEGRDAYRVTLRQTIPTYVMQVFGDASTDIKVEARANVLGGSPLCLLGLNPSETATVKTDDAKLSAPKCTIYSDSASPDGLIASGGGQMKAAFICSSGGAKGAGSLTPSPQLDCPPTPDPLEARPAPAVGGCDKRDYETRLPAAILLPGVYCGGLRINGPALVTLTPGVYVIKDGPLIVGGHAIVTGVGVGFFLTGKNAAFSFAPETVLTLTAPLLGSMAGMLFFEDRANKATTHKMESRDAPVLLGTFYLRNSELRVGAPGGPGLLGATIGALSAWTIIVADKVSIGHKLSLTLNSDYEKSKVPVPDGVGPYGSGVVLSE